jgi:hypothetical protein
MTKEKNITGHEATINSLDKGLDGSPPLSVKSIERKDRIDKKYPRVSQIF